MRDSLIEAFLKAEELWGRGAEARQTILRQDDGQLNIHCILRRWSDVAYQEWAGATWDEAFRTAGVDTTL
jgi:hypothetical protein